MNRTLQGYSDIYVYIYIYIYITHYLESKRGLLSSLSAGEAVCTCRRWGFQAILVPLGLLLPSVSENHTLVHYSLLPI